MTRAFIGIGLLSALVWGAGCATQDGTPPGVAEAQQALDAGRETLRKNRISEAIELFTQAVKSNPDLAEAWFERGKCEVRIRLDPKTEEAARVVEEKALDDFTAAIRKNPAYADAYFNRAMILASRAQYKVAIDDLLNAVRFNPQDPEAHRWLGELYEKKFEERIILAMEHYEKYIDLGGSDPAVREKVRIWKDFKKQLPTGSPQLTSRIPTPEDEKKAQELHSKGLELLKNPDKNDAVKVFEELLSSYGHTKYVQGKLQALQAVIAAFKKKDAQK
jgi:tetratricopeptide (TPR) repeat protein